jgi:hypothetical protein
VKGNGGAKVLEWNSLQWVDSIEEKYPDCGDITGDLGDPLEEFEACPLVSSDKFLSNECTYDTHRELCLCDSGTCSALPRLGAHSSSKVPK